MSTNDNGPVIPGEDLPADAEEQRLAEAAEEMNGRALDPNELAAASAGLGTTVDTQKPCCGNCNAFTAGLGVKAGKSGFCRANPPNTFIIHIGQDSLGRVVPTTIAQFPPMENGGWCRQFQLKHVL